MNAKLEKLRSTIRNSLKSHKIKDITIASIDNVEILEHQPDNWDESYIEKWTNVTILISVRGTESFDDGTFKECNYFVQRISISFSYSDEDDVFYVTEIDDKHANIQKMLMP